MTGKMLLQLISFIMFVSGTALLFYQNVWVAWGVLLLLWAYRISDVADEG